LFHVFPDYGKACIPSHSRFTIVKPAPNFHIQQFAAATPIVINPLFSPQLFGAKLAYGLHI